MDLFGLRPITIVEDCGLCELLAFLEPSNVVPSCTYVNSIVHNVMRMEPFS